MLLLKRTLKNIAKKIIRPQPRAPGLTPEQQKNFFDTFGYIKIEKFFSKDEVKWISKNFDREMKIKFPVRDGKKSLIFPQMIDYSPELSKILEMKQIDSTVSNLLGPNFCYRGSDGNIFNAYSAWHRDYFIRTKSIKMLIYLEKNTHRSGALRAIPGSHFVDDAFSSFLADAHVWPSPAPEGGFNEINRYGKKNNPNEDGNDMVVPSVTVATDPGDVIIFNHNLIHCTSTPKIVYRRRLLGLHFCVDLAKVPIESSPDELEEMRALSLLEMKEFFLEKFFGPVIHDSPSPKIQQMTAPLKDLRLDQSVNFTGYNRNSHNVEAITFFNRLKNRVFERKKFKN